MKRQQLNITLWNSKNADKQKKGWFVPMMPDEDKSFPFLSIIHKNDQRAFDRAIRVICVMKKCPLWLQ